ncbi:MAG: DUF4453 domain-containing protein [Alphaproteobacteria bacterium]|uniref:DUF4453 domain-containing protein n=1 Tax=Alexandriicola marinus TaxID=2081710 RepID=UPI000FDCD39D|nr:DUF4453 domain-containing protein [Alexandriicola marinus]MBM1222130.1 DUF4453 domain-containing protein [Ponticoccus sp. SC6-9]MBM1226817.1 DUF4453 domain-containing protein [Ponticoccus sp. SC6-15]MBM1231077.1 DUF4453 domain-containing protein [Ponticoccus sp. SC6-38]MBM1235671.1 DUF4453 domain-containing protein [Ponticoccus sp. SC6-45]MBM1240099.1 DUF4453 domain-containing protein [Ponticoccus sp. SC6-49]MBM1244453.1 DUF4453 domain-containing protein [Ponticoccus sp. SC2-64]MBM1249145
MSVPFSRISVSAAFAATLLSAPVPAAAQEICDALWFTRNLVFDRAGYCFSSPLGLAQFPADCTTTEPDLDPEAQALVAMIREVEEEWECDVDTQQTELSPFDTQVLTFIEDLPVPTGYESSCFGWKGGMLMLRAARREDAQPSGFVRPGDDLLATHADVDGWSFYSMTPQGQGLGWVPTPEWSEATCSALAG